jgi:hypothetical protein
VRKIVAEIAAGAIPELFFRTLGFRQSSALVTPAVTLVSAPHQV